MVSLSGAWRWGERWLGVGRKAETWIGEEEIRGEKKREEKINPEDGEDGTLTGDSSRRSSLAAAGGSSPATASSGARAGGG